MSEQETFDSIFRPGLFDGQIILVTGGGTGIGRCIAHELAHLGATPVIAGRREEPLASVVDEIRSAGGRAEQVLLNIRDQEAVDSTIEKLVEHHGRLDAVVNNAGGQFPIEAGELSPRGWLAVVDTNLNGTWWVSQAAFRHAFREQGRGAIVNMVADVWMGAPGMVYRRLFVEPQTLYCGRLHPFFDCDEGALTPAEVEARPYARRAYYGGTLQTGAFWPAAVAASADSMEALLVLILSGEFIGHLPSGWAEAWVRRGEIRPLLAKQFSYESQFEVVVRSGSQLTALIEAFLTDLYAVYRDAGRMGDQTA